MKYYLTAEEQAMALIVFPEEAQHILHRHQIRHEDDKAESVNFLSKLKQKYNIFSLR